ncbi:SOUL heme-binding protein [Raineyella antarctica]|uniref:SOUL heme-binding protein n=1 Tax=Raineyella antarctica TaxID=1577474 RepID=A0A1G6GL59_9ACTN|nr:heme-binding protein [Raineyella antarctica]SDB82583.1 SOUL heme-binding protein [Raineyella antarctica]
MAEQQPYEVLDRFTGFEVRHYRAHLVAEVEVECSFTEAGNRAFGLLAGFISGANGTSTKVAMTAPVVQEPAPTRIAMTSPVVQRSGIDPGRHVVGFVMPAGFSLDTLPIPSDPRVRVREVPPQVAAARAFTGRWSERIYQEQLAELRSAVEQAGLEISGPPRFARFDPPWTPWFLRHNEVVLPVSADAPEESDDRPA